MTASTPTYVSMYVCGCFIKFCAIEIAGALYHETALHRKLFGFANASPTPDKMLG
jgi:hypothetical protein